MEDREIYAFQSETSVPTSFSQRLRQALIHAGKNPDEHGIMAEIRNELGVSHVAVQKWMKGVGLPTQLRTALIAKWLGVSARWLYSGEGPMVDFYVTEEEQQLVISYRKAAKSLREAAKTILHINPY